MIEKVKKYLNKDVAPFIKIAALELLSQYFRIEVFKMIHKRGNGHWGGSSSASEIVTALYFNILNVREANPKWEERDRFILSKGHAAPLLYIILAEKGFFDKSELQSFRALNSILQGHPCMEKTPGVDISTGALGHGASIGLGMSLAAGLTGKKYFTWILLGDGDLNEGQTWEAFMAASKYKPKRLVFLIDYNKVQLDGPSEKIMPMESLEEKLKSFNILIPDKVYNGNSISEILESFKWIDENQNCPVAVIYNTVKGKGISFTENSHLWHGAPIDKPSYNQGLIELENNFELKRQELYAATNKYA